MSAPTATRGRVAVVGLGKMGAAIASRLLDAGVELSVGNRTPGRAGALTGRGATTLAFPVAGLAELGICITSLADDSAVDALILGEGGLLANARPGTLLLETSTISIAASRRIAGAAEERAVDYVRAPVSGNPVAVASGTATVFVSGPAAAIDRCRPVLEAAFTKVREVGEGDRARVLKLVLGVLIGGTAQLLAESLVLGESAGIDRAALLDAIGASVVGSSFLAYKSQPLLRDDYTATFTTAMMLKDIGLVLDLAAETGAELPVTNELRSLLEQTCAGGHESEDFMALLLNLKERSASSVRAQ